MSFDKDREIKKWAKYIERQFKGSSKFILVFNEKHDKYCYVISSVEELLQVCLVVLCTRFHDGNHYIEPNKEDYDVSNMTQEIADSLPEGLAKKAALQELADNVAAMRDFEEAKDNYEMIITALREKNGYLAFGVLSERECYEYEGFEIEYPVEVPTISDDVDLLDEESCKDIIS